MIAAYSQQLLDWLNHYTFPTEQKYADKEFARDVAKVFLQENLRNGITSGCVYCTVYPQSVDALFLEAAGALWKEYPDCFMQTHVSENKGEVAWVKELFPDRRATGCVRPPLAVRPPRDVRPRHSPHRR